MSSKISARSPMPMILAILVLQPSTHRRRSGRGQRGLPLWVVEEPLAALRLWSGHLPTTTTSLRCQPTRSRAAACRSGHAFQSACQVKEENERAVCSSCLVTPTPTAPRGGVHIHIRRCVTPGMRDGRRGPSFTRIRLAPKNGQRAKDAAKEARRTHNAGERDGEHTGRSWVCVGQRGPQTRTGRWQILGLDVPTDTCIQTPTWLFPVLVVL